MTPLSQMAASLRLAIAAALAALLLCVAGAAAAPPGVTTYNLPAALASSPFGCTLSSGINYNCGSISLTKDTRLNLTADVVLNIAGTFNASKSLESVENGYALTINTTGSMALQKDVNLKATLTAGGSMSIAKDAIINGNITARGSISIAKDSVINGNVYTDGSLSVSKGSVINGTCYAAGGSNYVCAAPVSGLHHVRLKHAGVGVTCTGSPVIINACSDADTDGSCSGSMTAVSGNVIAKTPGGTQLASVPFSIAANAGATSVTVQVTTAQPAVFSIASLSVAPSSASPYTCWNSTAENASCEHVYNDSGFLLSKHNHIAEQQQTLSVSAVKKADDSLACTPAFADVTRSVTFNCGHSNPSSGSHPVRLGPAPMVALNAANDVNAACGAGAYAVNLDFDENGVATTPLLYADSGEMTLTANYAPANMTGSVSFVAVPARFALSTAAPLTTVGQAFANGAPSLTAGQAFGVKVTALNALGNPTPNFGRESTPSRVLLGFTRCLPSGGADGAFSGNLLLGGFANGAASSGDPYLAWSEVGRGELTATLSDATSHAVNYLDSGLTVTGGTASAGACTGNVGPFSPAYFRTELTPAQLYVYSGQPITQVTVTPYNTAGIVTTNHYGDFARDVTLEARAADGTALPAGTGTLAPASVPSAAFAASGSASGTATVTPTYTFTAPANAAGAKPAPLPIVLRATTSSGSPVVSSSGAPAASSTVPPPEAATEIRFGRLQLSNAFGGSKQNLEVPVRAEYWTGKAWITNVQDSSTVIPAASVALTRAPAVTGGSVSSTVALQDGKGKLLLLKPSGKGYIDLAVNLGNTVTDQACVGAHAPSTGAAIPWLRSLNGNCPDTYNHDPVARASFGVFSPETNTTIHVREAFD